MKHSWEQSWEPNASLSDTPKWNWVPEKLPSADSVTWSITNVSLTLRVIFNNRLKFRTIEVWSPWLTVSNPDDHLVPSPTFAARYTLIICSYITSAFTSSLHVSSKPLQGAHCSESLITRTRMQTSSFPGVCTAGCTWQEVSWLCNLVTSWRARLY